MKGMRPSMADNLQKLRKLDERRMQEGEAVTTLERGFLLIRQRRARGRRA